ncbi:MAG: tRNA (guanosine(46)-N7)-methyltransferase TrmB [Candidatus Hydrothermia bacterium]
MPRPLNWTSIFGKEAPIELEIGFGRGDFLVQRARERPDVNLVGLEVSSLSVLKAWKRLAREGIPNVRIAKVDAASALFYFFSERSIVRVWVLFPEPWPKARHESRRLLGSGFLRLLAARTVDGGELMLATDWPDYRDWVISESERSGAFALESVGWPVPVTKYHEKWRAEGRDIYPLLFRKIKHPDVSGLFSHEIEMSQIKLEVFRELSDVVSGFRPGAEEWPGGLIRIQKAYISWEGAEALFLCLTSEHGFIQKFHVSAKRVGDVILIKPQDHAHLVITPGVKRCVEAVARILIPDK